MRVMKKCIAVWAAAVLLLSGCARGQEAEAAGGPAEQLCYTQIDQETARQMMEEDDGHIIVDVRTMEEYEEGHIPGAVCIPNETIGDGKPEGLEDPEQILLVYCRSGNRSKQAAGKLCALGYVNVYEFGGINTWTGEIEK